VEQISPAPVAVLEAPPAAPVPTAPIAEPAVEPDPPAPPAVAGRLGDWAAPATLAALVLLAGALLAAPFASLGALVRPLAALSLLTALGAVRSAHRAGRRQLYPIAVGGASAAVLLAALAAPALLGPGYQAAREPTPVDSGVRVVPLPAYVGEADQLGSEWVDARKATLQQGRVRVEVAEAWLGPAAKKDGRESAGSWLYVRVRLHRSRTGAEIAAGAFGQSLAWNTGARATVRDAAGSTIEQLPYRPPAARAGGASSAAGLSLDVADEVLAFEAPPAVASGLRLEVPGSAWGGSGSFRFALPGEMVQNRLPRPGKARGS
jgi:hypothetical protein